RKPAQAFPPAARSLPDNARLRQRPAEPAESAARVQPLGTGDRLENGPRPSRTRVKHRPYTSIMAQSRQGAMRWKTCVKDANPFKKSERNRCADRQKRREKRNVHPVFSLAAPPRGIYHSSQVAVFARARCLLRQRC